MLLQDLKDGVRQIRFGAKFEVVPGILGNLAEEFVQVPGQFGNRNPVILDMVFLLEDDPIQASSKYLGGFVKLLGEISDACAETNKVAVNFLTPNIHL